MNCMKCGRDMEPGQVFCSRCLETMGRYPVSPSTVVILPRRDESQRRSPARRKLPPTMEQQLKRSRRRSRRLAVLLALAILGMLALGAILVLDRLQGQQLLPGQNYFVIETTRPETE